MTRILITGLGTYWGSRLAQLLETRADVDFIVGVDTREPRRELNRTEFVRVKEDYGALRRIVEAAEIDTILHTHLQVDSTATSGRKLHEQNVIGTMNLLAAAGAPGSPVRSVVVKSSTLVYGAGRGDPQVFREQTRRSGRPQTRVEKSLLEVEDYLRDFAEDNPHVSVTLLRVANVLSSEHDTPLQQMLRLPAVPYIFGFDPLIQVVHAEDVAAALAYAVDHDLPGVYNVAADGLVPLSEVRAMLGRPGLPLPPFGTEYAAAALRASGVVDLPDELLSLLRFGRGVDNTALKHAGFRYRFSTVGAFRDYFGDVRLQRVVGDPHPAYEYQDDLEDFVHRHTTA